MRGRLEDKTAIVTGAGTGIGEAVAHKFAREGARVLVNGLADDPVEEVVAAINAQYGAGCAVACVADVSEEDQAIVCVEAVVRAFGKLDVLVNNAAVHHGYAEVDRFPTEKFDRLLKMNVRSAFLMTKLALPHLRRSRGVILTAGSEAGYIGSPQNTPYGGTKGFLHCCTIGVAIEQAKSGVRALL